MPAVPIQEQLQNLVSTKNPLSMVFSIARIREMVEQFADDLMNGIEKSYYLNTSDLFIELIEQYEKSGFFKIIYAYYAGSGLLLSQKAYLDTYFEQSYWQDVDFYFYVLEKHPQYKIQFEILRYFYENRTSQKQFLSLLDTADKQAYLSQISKELKLRSADYIFMPACLEFFNVLVAELYNHPEFKISTFSKSWKNYGRRVARDLYLKMIGDRIGPRVDFWRKYFIEEASISRVLVEMLDANEIFDCFRFLRMKILKTPRYNIALTEENVFQKFIDRSQSLIKDSIIAKLDYIADIHEAMGDNMVRREQFQSVLRKGLMYDNSIDLLDAILGISFLSRDAYYEIKRRALERKELQDIQFESLNHVKMLASTLESSIFLRFLRPFLIARVARVFNKNSDLYYFIKFNLTIHESKGYRDYKMLSRFFLSLEAFGKSGLYGAFLRMIQFGWLIVLAVVMFFIAPLGSFFAFIALHFVQYSKRIAEKKFPEVALTANFQFASYFVVIGVIFLSFGLTFGLKDNTSIVYKNFRTFINASTLVASESVGALADHFQIKASTFDIGEGSSGASILELVDYEEGKLYKDISGK